MQIQELVSRLQLVPACSNFLLGFLQFAAAGHANVASACGHAACALSALQELRLADNDAEAAAESIGVERLAAMGDYLTRKHSESNAKASKEQGSLRQRVKELSSALSTDMEEIRVHDEKMLVSYMTHAATHLASRQGEITKKLLLCEKAAKRGGIELEDEWKTSEIRTDAEMILGKCLFVICFYTAIVLYRGPAFGKRNEEGRKTQAHLKKVLEAINESSAASQWEEISK